MIAGWLAPAWAEAEEGGEVLGAEKLLSLALEGAGAQFGCCMGAGQAVPKEEMAMAEKLITAHVCQHSHRKGGWDKLCQLLQQSG